MKALLLGSTGFIGGSLQAQRPNWDWTLCNSKTFDLNTFTGTVDYHDVVINCSGFYGGLPFNTLYASEIVTRNARQYATIDRIVREIEPVKIVNIGSGCMYPGDIENTMSEDQIDTGKYHSSVVYSGISKRLSLDYLRQLPNNIGWEFLILSNVYGPGEPTDPEKSHVVGGLISKFLQGNTKLMGTGSGVRDFFYIEDAAEAICRYAEIPATNSHTNISSGTGTCIRDLVEIIQKHTGVDNVTWSNNIQEDGVPIKVLNNTKMQQDIGTWSYKNIDTGIQNTVEYIRNNKKGF